MCDIVLLNLLKIRKMGGKIVNFAATWYFGIAVKLRYLHEQFLPWG